MCVRRSPKKSRSFAALSRSSSMQVEKRLLSGSRLRSQQQNTQGSTRFLHSTSLELLDARTDRRASQQGRPTLTNAHTNYTLSLFRVRSLSLPLLTLQSAAASLAAAGCFRPTLLPRGRQYYTMKPPHSIINVTQIRRRQWCADDDDDDDSDEMVRGETSVGAIDIILITTLN